MRYQWYSTLVNTGHFNITKQVFLWTIIGRSDEFNTNIGRLLEFLIKFTNKTATEFNFSQHWTLKFTDIGISLDNRWEIRQDKH